VPDRDVRSSTWSPGTAVPDDADALRIQVARQVAHWRAATVALADLDDFAAPAAWQALESRLGTALRARLREAVDRLQRESDVLAAKLRAADDVEELEALRRDVVAFRRRFLATETALDFYGDAVNTRTSPRLAALLAACDVLASRSLEAVLVPRGLPVPPVLTYVDKGLGASILRSGLRLWDGRTLSAAAAVKVTRHNLYRPTAVLHETGHQAAFSLGWNDQLADALRQRLADVPAVAELWAGWASEIAADAFAFAHAGYASVAALHDVVAGEPASVFAVRPGDPHPVAYLRVLLGTEMCVRFFGAGPWDALARAWVRVQPLPAEPRGLRRFLETSVERLPRIVDACLRHPAPAFGGRPLTALVDPLRVRPDALEALVRDSGPALLTSSHLIWNESLRLLALSGYRAATEPQRAAESAREFERWMLRLGRRSPRAA
jgi:hypothetical protein